MAHTLYGKSCKHHSDSNPWVWGCGGYSECDSPWTLTNLTFDYLEKEWANNIDFVICTFPLYYYFLSTIDAKLTCRRDWRQCEVSWQSDDEIFHLRQQGLKKISPLLFRHDNDNRLPRTPSEIYELNR